MPVTIVYIPKKYNMWCKIPEDLRNLAIKDAKSNIDINKTEYDYEYGDLYIPKARRDLKKAWENLMDCGYITEYLFGYYDDSEDYYISHIFNSTKWLLSNLKLKINSFNVTGERCSCIVNISFRDDLSKLKTAMIEEFFK